MAWVGDAVVPIASAIVGAGVWGTWIKVRATRKAQRFRVTSEDIRECQDTLADVRHGYRLREHSDPDAPDDNALALLEDQLDKVAHRTLRESVVLHARLYVETGRSYASRDPDVGEDAERVAYDRLADSLMKELDRNR